MKIAITSDIYYPMTNGVAVFAHNLANGLAARGHEVMVVCPSFTGKPSRRKDSATGVTTVHLRSMRMPLYPDQINKIPEKREVLGVPIPRLVYRNGIWFSLYPHPALRKVLDKFKPDVIHNQTAEGIALAAVSYARSRDIPLVSTGHAYPDNITGQLKLVKPIKRPVDAVLRAYMASFLKNSEYATMPTEMAIDDLVPKNRRRFNVPVEALSNGVDLQSFKPGRAKREIYKKYNLPDDCPIVLYVGRVDPEKSIKNVVQAFRLVSAKMPEVRLVVVGDGTSRAGLIELAEDLGISDKVYFPGKIMPPDLMEIYKIGTLFATASETETQGIVLIEAAATGLPLVAVDAGAVRELCQNRRNGVLCEPGDIEALARGMMRIIKDPELCKRYSQGSLEIAKLHDLNRTLKRFEEIYEEAINLKQEDLLD